MKNTKSYEELQEIRELLIDATDRLDESTVKDLIFSHPDLRIAAYEMLDTVLSHHIDRGEFDSVIDETTAESSLKEFVNRTINDAK